MKESTVDIFYMLIWYSIRLQPPFHITISRLRPSFPIVRLGLHLLSALFDISLPGLLFPRCRSRWRHRLIVLTEGLIHNISVFSWRNIPHKFVSFHFSLTLVLSWKQKKVGEGGSRHNRGVSDDKKKGLTE